jgi:hypothetical protein
MANKHEKTPLDKKITDLKAWKTQERHVVSPGKRLLC